VVLVCDVFMHLQHTHTHIKTYNNQIMYYKLFLFPRQKDCSGEGYAGFFAALSCY
jgi:hypothetical protein